MSYTQIDSKSAKLLKTKDNKYSVYLCDAKNASMIRLDDKAQTAKSCKQFLYLIDSVKKSIQFSEICKNSDKYNVIFIAPDDEE